MHFLEHLGIETCCRCNPICKIRTFKQRKSICLAATRMTCDENAELHVINGRIQCFCKRGYYGNGRTCSGRFDKKLYYSKEYFYTFFSL